MFDFIQNGARRFEQLNQGDLRIALSEIKTRFKADWKSDTAQRCQRSIGEPLAEALGNKKAAPYLLRTVGFEGKKQGPDLELEAEANQDQLLHFLQIGDQLFPVATYDRKNRLGEIRLFPPIAATDFDSKAFDEQGFEALYGVPRKDVDSIQLFRDRAPTTHVAFGAGKRHEDESYGWALWEAIGSALRRGRAAAIKQNSSADALEAPRGAGAQKARLERAETSKKSSFEEVLPLLEARQGTLLPDGPPLGQDLLQALSWRGKTLTITRERGSPPRIRSMIREEIGDRPVWLELRFPEGAAPPTGGIAVTLRGDKLRVFGGLGQDGTPLDTEWVFDLASGASSAYARQTWKPSLPLAQASAWPLLISTDQRLLIGGGVAAFHVEKGAEQATPSWRTQLKEQSRARAATWVDAGEVAPRVGGGSVLVNGDTAFVGPGASLDGRVRFFDGDSRTTLDLPDLPGRLGLGQLHQVDNRLVYSGGFLDGAPETASSALYALDLEQLDGWKKIGNVPLLAGSNRLIERHGQLVVIGLSPKGRFTFIPGAEEGDQA